jgi:hypothetical protein
MSYQYAYLIWVLIFFFIWLSLFLWRRDVRKEMWIMSLLFGIGGVVSQTIYIQDWWQPLTLTGTKIGLEDFAIGFFIGGVASVIYEELYKKKISTRKKLNLFKIKTSIVGMVFLLLFFGSFYILHLNSFYSTLIAFSVSTFIMLFKRKDLIDDSLITGILMLIMGIIIYFLLQIVQPGFIKEFWYLSGGWYSYLLFGVPLQEYIWYFLAGCFIGPLYEYWQEGRLVKKK